MSSSSFNGEEECRAIVSKCKSTFVALRLLRDEDFVQIAPNTKTAPLTTTVGTRMRRGRERLEELKVPQALIFAAPSYLLIAPKLDGLLARMSKMNVNELPSELRGLHAHFLQNPSALDRRPQGPQSQTLFRVTKDGKRTAFTVPSGGEIGLNRSRRESVTSQRPHAAPEKTPSRIPAVVPQRSTAVQKESPPIVDTIFRGDLKPTSAQKAVLDSLFSGPLTLKALLKNSAHKPHTPHEASLFLLQHRKELEPYLFTRNRSDSVDLLKRLISQWASRIPTVIELQFSSDCFLSPSNQISLPIPRLSAVAVHNETRLIEARHRAQSCYKPAFALVHSTLGYLIEIVFQSRGSRPPDYPALEVEKTRLPVPREVEKPPRKKANRAEPASERLDVENFVALFGALDQRRANETRIAQEFVKPDFGALEGKAMQGGLPSLGKRRK
ncbi:hypothetical protein AB4Y40_23175 [Paraburkholderia sp. EG287B]|uniref:hypothetical protein n=1 Tax=Paraburkholderia sp. EG287B TaxID=3237010 RepID=UPI0034D20035